jgi:predicted RNase H-like HicB family nuclease
MKPESISQKSNGDLHLNVEVALYIEDDIWVAYCPALNLSSYGDDQEDAIEAFKEAMTIFIKEVTRKGTLEKVLLQLGWTLQQKPQAIYDTPRQSLAGSQSLMDKHPHFVSLPVALPVPA